MGRVDTVVAAAALAVALVAFVIASGQLLQQYFATADGYRRCQRSVMREWATLTRLRWRWREFRFETLYTASEFWIADFTRHGETVAPLASLIDGHFLVVPIVRSEKSRLQSLVSFGRLPSRNSVNEMVC